MTPPPKKSLINKCYRIQIAQMKQNGLLWKKASSNSKTIELVISLIYKHLTMNCIQFCFVFLNTQGSGRIQLHQNNIAFISWPSGLILPTFSCMNTKCPLFKEATPTFYAKRTFKSLLLASFSKFCTTDFLPYIFFPPTTGMNEPSQKN